MSKLLSSFPALLSTGLLWACGTSSEPAPLTGASGGATVQTGGAAAGSGGNGGSGGLNQGGGTLTGTGGMLGAVESDLPCDVQQTLSTYCWNCHGLPTDWGAPMSLVDKADFDAFGTNTTGSQVAALVKARINDPTSPMPPPTSPAMPQAAKDALNAWLDQAAPVGSDGPCTITAPASGGSDGSGGSNGQWDAYDTDWPGGVAPQETCYQFRKHGGQTPGDTTKHTAEIGESYINFFYKTPWTVPVVATRWRTLYDQTRILHHWLLYRSPAATNRDGNWAPGNGSHPGAQLLAVWAVGGGDEDFPPGVGLRLPGPDSMLEVEWHLYNTTGGPVDDNSGIEICVVPESAVDPQYIAGVHWLGTEDLGSIAANQESKRGGICAPSFKSGSPATIVKWMPHMHLLGVHMDTWILRANGSEEHVFDNAFDFDQQVMYALAEPLEIRSGDRIHNQCTFRNDTGVAARYGESTDNEMCYQFVFAYPAGSLDGANSFSLSGATNTCLSFNTPHP